MVGAVGSGLDVASIVAQLVSSERAPTDARFDRSERRLNAEISAIGTLRSAFSALRTQVTALGKPEALDARKATLPENANFSASTAANAAVGTYQVEVLALAKAHKLSSAAFATGATPVGTGQLTLTTGDRTINVTVDGSNNTLAGIRDAINTAAAGQGVSATLVTADDGAHLVLTALDAGTAKAIRVTQSGGDGGLAALTYDPPGSAAMSQLNVATDAQVRADGFTRTVSGNSVTDLIAGVTLNLTKEQPGTVQTLTIGADVAAPRNAAKNFVNAYNASLASINTMTSYNSTTKVAAALNGDAMVRGASSELRNLVSAEVSDLKSIGITIAKDGTLKLDEAAFDTAFAKDAAPVKRLFEGSSSMAGKLDAALDRLLDDDGLLDSRSDALSARTKSLGNQRQALDRRMESVEARYRQQFTALDSLVAQMQSTSGFLSQQLASF